MTQGFLQPKGSIKKQDIGPMVQQWAKEQAQGQLNSTPEVNPLRDTVQDLLLKNLQKDITIPKTYTTIQDIFNANEGDRFNALADWFQSPQFNRFTGGDYTFDPESGRMMSTGERIARRQEAQLKAEQEKALEAQKQQLGIAEGLNKEFTDMDIADKKLKADAEQFAQSLALDREKLAEMRRHNQAMEANAANKIGGANGLKMVAADRKALTENKTTISNIEAGLKALEENPDAYQWYKGVLGADITNRIDPKGVATRTQIDNITAVYRKWLTGAQMSDKERKAYERFLPAPTDNYNIVKAKLEGMKAAVERSNKALLSNYGVTTPKGGDPLDLGL